MIKFPVPNVFKAIRKRAKVIIYPEGAVECPGKRHVWVQSSVGRIRKPATRRNTP